MNGLKIDQGAWVLVCDGGKALVLQNAGNRQTPRLVTREVYRQEDLNTREVWSDRPGQASNPTDGGRGGMEQADFNEQDEQRFLAQLADRLHKAVLGGEMQALVVVAPPRAIGVLRREFSDHVRGAIAAEVERDYVKMPIDEITRHLVQ